MIKNRHEYLLSHIKVQKLQTLQIFFVCEGQKILIICFSGTFFEKKMQEFDFLCFIFLPFANKNGVL